MGARVTLSENKVILDSRLRPGA